MNRVIAGLGAFGILAWLAIIGACSYGYIHNIVMLVRMLDGPTTNMFIARIVGIFAAPLGVILGYF